MSMALRSLSDAFHLAEHDVCAPVFVWLSFDFCCLMAQFNGETFYTAVDVEGHLIASPQAEAHAHGSLSQVVPLTQQLFIIDPGRIFPPTALQQGDLSSNLFNLFRPGLP